MAIAKTIAFFIDEPQTLKPATDSSIAFMQICQANGYRIAYFTMQELFYENGDVKALAHFIEVSDDLNNWYREIHQETYCLYDCEAVIIRKDPPFDQNYLYATYLLDLVEQRGIVVSNSAQGIRDANEKIFATHFAPFTPPTLISQNMALLTGFLNTHQKIVVKALNNRSGNEVLMLDASSMSAKDILAMMCQDQTRTILVQKFIPEVSAGDKRILLINGEPVPHVLLRTPPKGGFIANTGAGGTGTIIDITEEDQKICRALTPVLQKMKLDFVGIDIINGYLTEINVTSATATRLIMREVDIDIPNIWYQCIDSRLKNR